jgi:hypothetical protein
MRIKQDATYEGSDRWSWSVWVDAPEEELSKIDYVEYILHPTFADPTRRVADRSSKFRLDSRGWGEFTVRAVVVNKDGEKKNLRRWLKLEYPPVGKEPGATEQASSSEGVKSQEEEVYFLSCAIGDSLFANALSKALIATGARVLMVADEPSDLPWESSIDRLLDQADYAIFIISDALSIWMQREIEATAKHEVPIIPVVIVGSKVKLTELQSKMESPIHIKPLPPEKFDDESQEIAERIKKAAQAISQKASKKKLAKG